MSIPLKARDPRTGFPSTIRHRLAARPENPALSRYCLIQCMPPHNGIEETIAPVQALLGEKYPHCKIELFHRRDFMIDDPAERAAIAACSDAVILFAGPASTSIHVCWKYGVELEKAGIPVCLVFPESLGAAVQYEGDVCGTRLRTAMVPWNKAAQNGWTDFAETVLDALLADLQASEISSGPYQPFAPERYVCEGTIAHIHQEFQRLGLTDGLPMLIPTDKAVDEMLGGTSRRPDDVVCATLRPEGLLTTVEHVAINAVMAGASPCHLPVILASVGLFGGIELESMTRSVNSFAFTHLINGPIAHELEIAGGTNAVGSGNPANEVIARAIGLVIRNCGHQRIGVSSSPVQGSAAGISVFAENVDESPWPSFHTTLGHTATENVVSLFVGGFGIVGNFYYRGLDAAAKQLELFDSPMGALLLLSAKRAREWSGQGLGREEVIDFLWRGAAAPLGEIRCSGFFPLMKALIQRGGDRPLWPSDYLTRPDSDIVPIYPKSGLHVAVVGSALGSMMQLWNSALHATASIDVWR